MSTKTRLPAVPQKFNTFNTFNTFATFNPALAYQTLLHRQEPRARSVTERDFRLHVPPLPAHRAGYRVPSGRGGVGVRVVRG